MSLDQILKSLQIYELGHCAEQLIALGKPAVQMRLADTKPDTMCWSHLGGDPELASEIDWPVNSNGTPLSFIGQISLSELSLVHKSVLPSNGCLYIFYDCDCECWGFDPKHFLSWRVVYESEDLPTNLKPRKVLQVKTAPTALELLKSLFVAELKEPSPIIFPRRAVKFIEVLSLPCYDSKQIDALELNDSELEKYTQWWTRWDQSSKEGVALQILGYPNPIQANEMETECQLVSNGIYLGGGFDDKDPQVRKILDSVENWELLFQVNTFEELDMMWGDAGSLYFWIQTKDLQAMNFSRVWTILQSF